MRKEGLLEMIGKSTATRYIKKYFFIHNGTQLFIKERKWNVIVYKEMQVK